MIISDSPGVVEVLRAVFKRHRPYNAMSFKEFLDAVSSAKNMVTRHSKNTLCAGEGCLINSIICISNYVGPETTLVFEVPAIVEPQYAVVRPVLKSLGLPYRSGEFDTRMETYIQALSRKS